MAADGAQGSVKAALDTRLTVPGIDGFEVVRVALSEGLSRRTAASVEISSGEDIDWSAALLQACALDIELEEQGTRIAIANRRWTLAFGEARFIEHKDNSFRYVLSLYDPLWPLSLGRDTRKFRNLSATEIVSLVLGEAKIPHEWRLAGAVPTRKYTVQYRESKLAFIERLMEFEGIFYSFAPDGTVIFADNSQSAERLRAGTPYELIEASDGMSRGDVGLHVLRRGRRIQTGKVTLGDYNWKQPKTALCTSAEGEHDNTLERYVYPAGFRKDEQGVRLAKLRVEAYRARASYLEGKSNDPFMAPGLGMGIGGAAAAAFEGEYLLTNVVHASKAGAFSEGKGDTEESRYEVRFEAIPIDRAFRPFLSTPRPTVDGIHTAMVRGPSGEEIHTDEYGRFKAQLHWDREGQGNDEDSRWIRLLQESSSSMTLARVGWEVMVGYVDGDPDRPIGLGRAINGQMTPTYSQPAQKTMMAIKTPSSPATGGFNELKLDDSAGSQHISIQAEKDYDALVKNDKSETIGENETHTVTNDFRRHIQGHQRISIGANDTATYESKSELKVGGNRKVAVAANESVTIGGGQKATVTKTDAEKVGTARINIVGSIKMPDFKGMAKAALDGLNPIKALEGKLKSPLSGLLPGLTGKDTAEVGKNLLAKLKGLPEAVKNDVLATVKAEGQGILKSAEKDAKAAQKEKGLAGAADAGWSTLTNSADQSLGKVSSGLPATIENSIRSNLESILGPLPAKDPKTGASAPSGPELTGFDKAKADAAASSLQDYVKNLPDVFQAQAENYVKGILPDFGQDVPAKFEGLGGVLPSMDQLKNMYSKEAIQAGLTGKLEGALNTATGGLFETFFPKPQNKGENAAREFTIGWDQIDKLVDMFSIGGISKTTEKSIKVLVGGVSVKTALRDITWGSEIAWMETIGGVKFTRSPKDIGQEVEGKMKLTVLGKISRNAGEDIKIECADTSTINVGAKATFTITETIEWNGKTQLLVETTGEFKLQGAKSTLLLSPKGLRIDTPKLGISEAPSGVTLKGAKLDLTKS